MAKRVSVILGESVIILSIPLCFFILLEDEDTSTKTTAIIPTITIKDNMYNNFLISIPFYLKKN